MATLTAVFTVLSVISVFMLILKATQIHGSIAHYGGYKIAPSWWFETFIELGVISLWINMLLFKN